MDNDDPHVRRTIRTQSAVISIVGTLTEVDRLYRISNRAFLDNGYTLPKPSQDPWSNYEPATDDNSDHLRRRVAFLESVIEESENHTVIQNLRRELSETKVERDIFRQAFHDLDTTVQQADRALNNTNIDDNLCRAIVLEIISE